MKTYLALLRGINVSGQKKMPMAELRSLMENMEFRNVQTYIQSGNVIFQSSEKDPKLLEQHIKNAILSHFGFEVPVLVKTGNVLKLILDDCPFIPLKKERSYFTLLHYAPENKRVDALGKMRFPNEEFVISEHCVYLYSSTGYGRAKCNNNFFEHKLKVTATTRNYKTMMKLLSLCEDLS